MDPFTLGLSALGFGLNAAGGIAGIFGANKNKELNDQIYLEEQKANRVRKQAMYLQANRQQLQNIRNIQLQRSMALQSATSQGAQLGTGLQGGYGQISGQGYFNQQGINQNLELGNQMFDINDTISSLKAQQSANQTQMAMWQGISGLGNSILGAAGKAGQLGQNLFAGMNFGTNTYGGTYGYTSSNYGSGYN